MADDILTPEKACTKCGKILPATFDNFFRQKSKKDGFKAECKTCSMERRNIHYELNAEDIKEKARLFRLKNIDKARANDLIRYKKAKQDTAFVEKNRDRVKEWAKANPEKVNAQRKLYRLRHQDRLNSEARLKSNPEAKKAYYEKNKDKYLQKAAKWADNNKQKVKEIRTRHKKKKMQDPWYRLNNSISCQIRNSINDKGGRSWQDAVGFTLEELKKHLELQFVDGMSWDNYGEWHVDHITPVSSFTCSSIEDKEFKSCWHISNLRPLWAVENIKKRNKLQFLL